MIVGSIYLSPACLSHICLESRVYTTPAFTALLILCGSDFQSFLLFPHYKSEAAFFFNSLTTGLKYWERVVASMGSLVLMTLKVSSNSGFQRSHG